ncbi:hypothetical protein HY620_03545 [Candidatus Uhrbacteria bacterium]|nr:hypothetical protein [Candidatus Uhrbacteria bacterium]
MSYLNKKLFQAVGILLIGIIFFLVYSFLSFSSWSGSTIKFNSPDETANYYFARQIALTGNPWYEEPLLDASKGLVHPRSMTVAGSNVVPVSFLGMVYIYGGLANFFGVGILPYLTPFFAVVGVGFFALFLAQFFSRRIALLSSLLLFIHPAYWYNASRAMLPNVLFIDILIIGCALTAVALKKIYQAKDTSVKPVWWYLCLILGGLGIGTALSIRLSESLWVMGVFILVMAYGTLRRYISIRSGIGVSIGIAVPLLLLLATNNHVYGNPMIFGYQTIDFQPSAVAFEKTVAAGQTRDIGSFFHWLSSTLTPFIQYILPFGFAPRTFLGQFQDYFAQMFWWTVPFLLLGVGSFAAQFVRARSKGFGVQTFYGICVLAVSAWLIIFYGSWTVHDNVAKEVTIGNSYVRYWLPMFVFSLPFVAYGFFFLASRASRGFVRSSVLTLCIATYCFFSFQLVLWQAPEGLFHTVRYLRENFSKLDSVSKSVPASAIIISQRSDKIFFPEFKVASSFETFSEAALLPAILQEATLYYYGFWKPTDAAFVSEKYFKKFGLDLEYVAQIDEKEYLYKVVKSKE